MHNKRVVALVMVLALLLVVAAPAAANTSALLKTRVEDFRYRPRSQTGLTTDTFGWKNFGPSRHTVTSDDGVSFDSGAMAVGAIFPVTGLAPGTYAYHCSFHPTMMGRIIVN